MRQIVRFLSVACVVLGLLGVSRTDAARAADLTIGVAVEPDSIDPHFHWFGGDLNLTFQIFEPLIRMGRDGKLHPGLATSWKPLDPTSWEFDLRPGVTFQDGTPFTAADVAFTLKRAPNVPRSPSGFGTLLNGVTSVETPGPQRVIVHTAGPDPLLPTNLTLIGVISQHAGENAATADYNSGKAAIGTGPYRFVSWSHSDRIILERNPHYWGTAPDWDKVTLRFIPDAAARLAAIRAHDVDMIDGVSLDGVPVLRRDSTLRVTEAVSNNVIGFQVDVKQHKPPFITAANGDALETNPLADLKVRRALAMAINRPALKDHVMNGGMAIADQIMAPGQFGYDPDFKPIAYDPDAARKLLAEAGYPDGFRMTMHCQANRYPNGTQLCEAVAQMFIRIGIKATPDPLPHLTFIGHANKHEYSLFTMYMLNDTQDPTETMVEMFGTANAKTGWGVENRGQYDNAEFDRLLIAAEGEVDSSKREALLRQAEDLFTSQVAWIPLLRPLNIEAMRASLDHRPRSDGYLLAADVHPAAPKQ